RRIVERVAEEAEVPRRLREPIARLSGIARRLVDAREVRRRDDESAARERNGQVLVVRPEAAVAVREENERMPPASDGNVATVDLAGIPDLGDERPTARRIDERQRRHADGEGTRRGWIR